MTRSAWCRGVFAAFLVGFAIARSGSKGPDDSPQVAPSPSPTEDRVARLDERRYRLERAVVLLTLFLLVATGAQAWSAQQQVDAAQKQVDAAQQQVDAGLQQTRVASDQLRQGQYQSVYDRMLDMDRMLAEQPEIAPYILEGYRSGDRVTKNKEKNAALKSAMIYVLDLYGYIWDNVPDLLGFPSPPTSLALRSTGLPPDSNVTVQAWEAWTSWSETIAAGFRDSPELCTVLDQARKAYGSPFVGAIRDARLCKNLRLPTEP
jgi:hypothetical protein